MDVMGNLPPDYSKNMVKGLMAGPREAQRIKRNARLGMWFTSSIAVLSLIVAVTALLMC